MELIKVNDIQFSWRPISELNQQSLQQIDIYKKFLPFCFQASSFFHHDDQFGMLCSVPDGRLVNTRPSEKTWRRLLFEAVNAYFYIPGNWTINEDFIYYYDTENEMHLIIDPQLTVSKISIIEYGELFYRIMCGVISHESLLRVVKLENFNVWVNFFENLLDGDEDILSHELFEGMTFTAPILEFGTVSLTPRLFLNISALVSRCIDIDAPLEIFFTAVDLLIRCNQKEYSHWEKILNYTYAFYGIGQYETDEDFLMACDGVIISSFNPYFIYQYVDELVLFYITRIVNPLNYTTPLPTDYQISLEPKNSISSALFFQRPVPLKITEGMLFKYDGGEENKQDIVDED